MKKFRKAMSVLASLVILGGGIIFSSCSSDDDDDPKTDPVVSLTDQIARASGDVNLNGKSYSEDVSISRACKVSNATFSGNTITVNVTGVTLEGIKGAKVIAAEGIGSGDLYIKDCEITELTVKGGGSNSIHISGSAIVEKLTALKEKVRLALEDAVKITQLIVQTNNVTIKGSEKTEITNLQIESTVEKVAIGGGTVETLTVVVENESAEAPTVVVTEAITVTEVVQETATGEVSEVTLTIQVTESANATAGTVNLPEEVATETVSDDVVEDFSDSPAEDDTETTVAGLADYLKKAKSAGKTSVKATVTDATVDNFATITAALVAYGQVKDGKGDGTDVPELYVDLDLTESTGLTAIPYRAFTANKNEEDNEAWKTGALALKSIELPSSVEYLEALSFWCLQSLESVTLNDGLTAIWTYAFCGSGNIKSINIPSSVTYIDDAAFSYWWTTPSVKFDSTAYVFEDNLILSKDKTELIGSVATGAIKVPSTVTKIHSAAFKGWRNVESITLPTPASGKWYVLNDIDVDVSALSATDLTQRLTFIVDGEETPTLEKYADSEWVVVTPQALPYSIEGEIKTDEKVSALAVTENAGLSMSFFIRDYTSDWSMIFQTAAANIGLTALHYCDNFGWKGNYWPSNYPSENSPAASYDVFLNTYCYVTISISSTGITFYKNGEKMFNYDDTNGGFAGDESNPSMAAWCKNVINSISVHGITTVHPGDSWASANASGYTMSDLYITAAMTAEQAKARYEKVGPVEEAPVESIAVTTPPTITSYTLVGTDSAAFDSTGLVVTATLTDKSTKKIPASALKFGLVTESGEVTVTYGEFSTKVKVEMKKETYNQSIGTSEEYVSWTPSKDWTVSAGSAIALKFKNYGSLETQWFEFINEFYAADGGITLRADNYYWGFAINEKSDAFNIDTVSKNYAWTGASSTETYWSDFAKAIGAGVEVTVTVYHTGNSVNVVDSATLNNSEWTQTYIVPCNSDAAKSSINFHITEENSYLVFGTGVSE